MQSGRESDASPLSVVVPIPSEASKATAQRHASSGHPGPRRGAAELAWEYGDDGCAVIDSGVFTAANAAFGRLVGRPAPDIVGLTVSDVFAPTDIAPVVDSPDDRLAVPVAGLLGNGRPFLAEIDATRTGGDELILRARRRLPTIVTDSDQPTVDRNEIVTALSHDVRGRLGVASGFLSLALSGEGGAPPERQTHLLERAASATDTVDLMLERLVHFLRLGEAVFHLTPTSLGPVVAAAASTVGVDISTSGEPLPTAFANVPLLIECLTELFGNAVEFAQADVPITIDVSARIVGRWCELAITDNGRGIPPHLVEQSLGLFRQLQSRNWERGVGMGLAVCRRIIDGHGGTIALHGDGTAGTTTVLRLALADAPT